ncbi:MAG: hypothetical protein A3H91_01205 [Gammaproteobacteria bacterium RIFCSPLOWO2_02_FULL_61_13]|nr:MAG: hypothetical protein A3H91_01205 [Gammaproteobacteria bacterium RIFCSPLOWO2_02_FULL_61_13]
MAYAAAIPSYGPLCTYTVSARGKDPHVPVFRFLRNQFGNLALAEIDSLFGFVSQSPLYGGRAFVRPELSERDVFQLNRSGIGLRLPLSNHYVDREEYERERRLLARYHRGGNSVIVTNDELARWIRSEFPLYRLDASVIKNIHTHAQIDAALEVYDDIVLPMELSTDYEFLDRIEARDRVILFANAGCALTCPSRTCYASISRINKCRGGSVRCSRNLKPREQIGMVDFDLVPLLEMGYYKFKLLRPRPSGVTGY